MASPTPDPARSPIPSPPTWWASWWQEIQKTPRAPLITAAILVVLDVAAVIIWLMYQTVPLPLLIAGVVGTLIIALLLPVLGRISTAPQTEVSQPAKILIWVGVGVAILFIAGFCWYTNSYISTYTALEKAKLSFEVKKLDYEAEKLKVTPASADWGQDNIPDRPELATESEFLRITSPNPTNDKDDSLAWEASMDNWKDWLKSGCPGEEEGGRIARQTLVVESDFDSGFDKNYNDIFGKIELDHGIQLKGGACFLVREIELTNKVKAPILRQQPFLIEVKENGKYHRNEFQLLAPRQGERLIFILRVQKMEGMAGALPLSATSYGVNIKTSSKRNQQ